MAESNSQGRRTDPLSFYIEDLYAVTEAGNGFRSRRMSLERISEEDDSRSSHLTALPRWESFKHPQRPKINIPFPKTPKPSHLRTVSTSSSPILEKDALAKEFSGRSSSGNHRSIVKPNASHSTSDTHKERRHQIHKRLWFAVVGITVLILAITLVAILGDYFSRRHRSTSTAGKTSDCPTPTSTELAGSGIPTLMPTPKPPQIASLAVTGWDVPGPAGYSAITLFWQDIEGNLTRAVYNSSTGDWSRVANFVKAKNMTPLAAKAFSGEWYAVQQDDPFSNIRFGASVIYLDVDNNLQEWIFPDNRLDTGKPGPLSGHNYRAHENTMIASYWPNVIYQGMSGEIRRVSYACQKNQCWRDRALNTTEAVNGTRLAVIPMRNKFPSLGLFYQEKNGRVLAYSEEGNGPGSLWWTAAFSNHIPERAVIATFSIKKSDEPADSNLSVYLLWQDKDDNIQMSWTDNDGAGWYGPNFYPAFAGADANTILSCLTGLTFRDSGLPPGTGLARCYFLSNGTIQEVSFDGDGWNVVGAVPLGSAP